MRWALMIPGLVVLPLAAVAQTPDPRMDSYRQLLSEANDRLVQATAVNTSLRAQIDTLTKQLEEATRERKAP